MSERCEIKRLFISWYDKDSLSSLLDDLRHFDGEIIASDGTAAYLMSKNIPCISVSQWTGYPEMLGGRVKTLHPLVMGSILARVNHESDKNDIITYHLKPFDLVCVQLYPFDTYLAQGSDEDTLIEKIDIGGVSLIRAAAKNFRSVAVISSEKQIPQLQSILKNKFTTLKERKRLALEAFSLTFQYDARITKWLGNHEIDPFLILGSARKLRYGENPDQVGYFLGDLSQFFEILQGKELSYNNLLDISAALELLGEFGEEPVSVVIKHGNPCGVAGKKNQERSLQRAIASDPVSAFGGIIATSENVDKESAEFLSKMFFEVLIAPSFSDDAFKILSGKQNRILITLKALPKTDKYLKQINLGYLLQSKQEIQFSKWELAAGEQVDEKTLEDARFGIKVVKHLASNAIAIVKDQQLIGAGMGQPNRVDSVRHAIDKAKKFGFDTRGSVLVSDGFFPFADSIELAFAEGINVIVEPGGSVKDKEIIQFCNEKRISLIFTNQRYFKH